MSWQRSPTTRRAAIRQAALALALAPLALLAPAPAFAQPAPPHASWTALPFSNGFAAGVYNAADRKLDVFLPHVYQAWDSATYTRDILFDAQWGIVLDGAGAWLKDVPDAKVEYLPGTGIVRTDKLYKSVKVSSWLFAPMGLDLPAVVMLARVEITDSQPHAVALYSLHNFHLGGSADAPSPFGESAQWYASTGTFVEAGTSGNTMQYLPMAKPSHYAASPDNPYQLVLDGKDLPDNPPAMWGNDLVSGFQFSPASPQLMPGESMWGGVVLAHGATGIVDAVTAWAAALPPDQLLQREINGWSQWQDQAKLPATWPAGIDGQRLALARQSLAMLRMAQVREPNGPAGSPYGQILASMPPGQWNIAWVRDGAYSVVALAKLGYLEEARAALDFVLNGKAGQYMPEVGQDYAVSVCRYFGNGTEWSDGADTPIGPNIELDNFGLFLWAASEWYLAAQDHEWLAAAWPMLSDRVASVLADLVEPGSGLVKADSSIWETHWNGFEKHYAYTDITAARGLCDAAWLAQQAGDPGKAASYAAAAHALRRATLAAFAAPQCADDPAGCKAAFLGNTEEIPGDKAVDAAVVEALLMGIAPPDSPLAHNTLSLFDKSLFMELTGHGYRRNDDGGWYDRQEWVFIDLRVALASRLAGLPDKANALLDWVTAQSKENFGLVAELYDESTADYQGAVPMAGYGAAAFLLAMVEASPCDFSRCLQPPPVEPEPENRDPEEADVPLLADAREDSAVLPDSRELVPPADALGLTDFHAGPGPQQEEASSAPDRGCSSAVLSMPVRMTAGWLLLAVLILRAALQQASRRPPTQGTQGAERGRARPASVSGCRGIVAAAEDAAHRR